MDGRSGPKRVKGFEIPREHAITRLYVLPAGSGGEFMAELEDDTEEPTPELQALFRGVRGNPS